MKNKTVLALIAALALAAAGCASEGGDSSSEKAEESSSTAAAETPAPDSESEKIKELSLKIEQLSKRIDDLEKEVETFSYDRHEIYDDTAVIEAYKKSDSSPLTDEKDKFIYEQLTSTLKEIIHEGMTDYEKEKAVYDYIFGNANYNYRNLNPVVDETEEDYSHTPYGFFHDHSVICVGYATTFKLYMDALGIECRIIHSTEQGEHAWDIVKIGGDWYHVDVFFDGGIHTPLYGAFNVTDSIKKQQGYAWNTGNVPEFPECTSLKYNPIVKEAKECKSVYELPEKIAEIGKGDKTGTVFLKVTVPEDGGVYAFADQLENILTNIIFDNKQLCCKCFADPETGFCYAGVSVELREEEPYGDDKKDDIPEDKDHRYADIDYDRLSREFGSKFGDEAYFSFDPETYSDDEVYYERGAVY